MSDRLVLHASHLLLKGASQGPLKHSLFTLKLFNAFRTHLLSIYYVLEITLPLEGAVPTEGGKCVANQQIAPFRAARLTLATLPGLLTQHPKELCSAQLPAHSGLAAPSLNHLFLPLVSSLLIHSDSSKLGPFPRLITQTWAEGEGLTMGPR